MNLSSLAHYALAVAVLFASSLAAFHSSKHAAPTTVEPPSFSSLDYHHGHAHDHHHADVHQTETLHGTEHNTHLSDLCAQCQVLSHFHSVMPDKAAIRPLMLPSANFLSTSRFYRTHPSLNYQSRAPPVLSHV
ncbi:MAG: hypothetical protein C9356_01545 [Oleiphilus sp.]|nr:MAG: hypothetical protein C9356_01545 [Oleiphilus sp.]